MKLINLIFLVVFSLISMNRIVFSLEMKPVINLSLAKKMADVCEAKRDTGFSVRNSTAMRLSRLRDEEKKTSLSVFRT